MESLPGLRTLAPDWLDRLADLWPQRIALVTPHDGERHTYAALRDRAEQTACTLASLGVRKGDRVATLLQNGVESIDLFFACARLGAILVPLNWRLSPRELEALTADADPAVLIADPDFEAACATSSARVVSLTDRDALLRGTGAVPETDVRTEDPLLILYTGGTTGLPKGAVLTHSSILWNAINTAVSWGLSESDIGPSFTPMFHTGGWNVFTLPLLLIGARVILPHRFDPTEALQILQEERPTLLFFVPTMFRLVAEAPDFPAADLSSLRWVISGGAPLPEPVIAMWSGKVRIFKQGYGLTEVGPNNFATSDEDALRIRGSNVGKPTFFARMRIVDDAGNDLPAGECGELLLAGPHMCAGYWRRPDATAEAIRDGWFHTGDIARCDADGFYYIVDRKKDMIISGGENIYPTEIEAALYEHPAVREAAVVGLPDPTWGEAVTAVVSLKPDCIAAEDDLRVHMRKHLARYKIPKRFVVVDDIPKNAAGKILRSEARTLASLSPR